MMHNLFNVGRCSTKESGTDRFSPKARVTSGLFYYLSSNTANAVYLVKDTYREALLCLDVPLDMPTVDYFKGHKEQRFICLEQALDTTRKWNLKHHLGDKFVAF